MGCNARNAVIAVFYEHYVTQKTNEIEALLYYCAEINYLLSH